MRSKFSGLDRAYLEAISSGMAVKPIMKKFLIKTGKSERSFWRRMRRVRTVAEREEAA